MTHTATQPPWEFLLSASRTSLQSFELSRLSHAANIRKQIGQLLDLWVDEISAAQLARWIIEYGELLRKRAEGVVAGDAGKASGASDNIYAEQICDAPAHSRTGVGHRIVFGVFARRREPLSRPGCR